MKKILILLLIITLSSCGVNDISEEKIKTDLIGTSIDGAWSFDMPSEFLDLRIIDEKDTGGIKEIKTEFILKDFGRKSTHYYLLASLVYKKENGDWKYIKGNKLSFKKTNRRIKFKGRILNSNNPDVIAKEVIKAIIEEDYLTINNYAGEMFKNSRILKSLMEDETQIKLKKIEILKKEKKNEYTVYSIELTLLDNNRTRKDNSTVWMKQIDGNWKFMDWN